MLVTWPWFSLPPRLMLPQEEWHSSAAERDHRLLSLLVQGPRDKFLTGPALARNQHRLHARPGPRSTGIAPHPPRATDHLPFRLRPLKTALSCAIGRLGSGDPAQPGTRPARLDHREPDILSGAPAVRAGARGPWWPRRSADREHCLAARLLDQPKTAHVETALSMNQPLCGHLGGAADVGHPRPAVEPCGPVTLRHVTSNDAECSAGHPRPSGAIRDEEHAQQKEFRGS